MEHDDFEHRQERNLGCVVVVNGSEECTLLVAPRSRNYVLSSDEKKPKLCEIIKIEDIKLPKEVLLFGHMNVQHEGC